MPVLGFFAWARSLNVALSSVSALQLFEFNFTFWPPLQNSMSAFKKMIIFLPLIHLDSTCHHKCYSPGLGDRKSQDKRHYKIPQSLLQERWWDKFWWWCPGIHHSCKWTGIFIFVPKNNDYSIICSITAHQSLFFSQWGTDVPLTIILVGKLWVGLDGGWREGGRLWVPLEHCKVLQQMDGGGWL